MADNAQVTAGVGTNIAADEVTYSGDTTKLQINRLVHVSGTEGSKVVAEIAGAAGSPGTAALTIQGIASGTAVPVSNAGTFAVQSVGSVAHDGVGTAVSPVLVGGYGYNSVPTDVNADGDAVRGWFLRSGALAVQDTLGGVLSVGGNGATSTGVQRVTIANDSTGVLATVTNVATIGTSITPGTGPTHLGKAEDAVHANGDTGVMVLAVRNDAGAVLAGSTGDYIPISTDSTGAVRVTGAGGTQYAEDSVAVSGDSLMVVGAVRRDTAATSVSASGDYEALSTNATGALRVTIDSYGTGSAATATTDSITVKLATDAIQNGLVALTPKFAAIAAATSGNNSLVALVSSKKIRVLSLMLFAGAAGDIYFTSNSGGTVIFGGSANKIKLAANQGFVLDFSPVGWMETASGEALFLNTSSTGPFSGGLTYIEV